MPGSDLPTTDDVASALNTADFPASKDDLIRYAQAAGADEAVVRALRSLPPEIKYANRDEVLRSIDTMEASGTTPSQHAARARTDAPPGVAQHQRTPDPR